MRNATIVLVVGLLLALAILFYVQRRTPRGASVSPAVPLVSRNVEVQQPTVRPIVRPAAEDDERWLTSDDGESHAVSSAPQGDVIGDEYIFEFFSESDRAAFLAVADRLGVDVLGRMAFGRAVRVRVPNGDALDRLLREAPEPVEYGANYRVRNPSPPDLEKREARSDYAALGAGLLDWLGVEGDNSSWGRGVTVAVLDTAIGRHEALAESHVLRTNPYDLETEGAAHGLAVASLIVGLEERVDGVAPGARVLSIPVLNADGQGDTFTLASAIVDAVAQGADVINLSLGSYGDSFLLRDAVRYALESGVAIVAATGNDAINAVTYPARYEGVIAVSAVDAAGNPVYFANSGAQVDISAPGFGVQAGWRDDQIVYVDGTSAAAPIVSGAIAALMSLDPELDPGHAAELLMAFSNDSGLPGRDDAVGAGTVNIGRVLGRDAAGQYDMVMAPPLRRNGRRG